MLLVWTAGEVRTDPSSATSQQLLVHLLSQSMLVLVCDCRSSMEMRPDRQVTEFSRGLRAFLVAAEGYQKPVQQQQQWEKERDSWETGPLAQSKRCVSMLDGRMEEQKERKRSSGLWRRYELKSGFVSRKSQGEAEHCGSLSCWTHSAGAGFGENTFMLL